MSFVRVKRIHGRTYRYLVQSFRDGGRVRQRVVKYLGPVNPVVRKKKPVAKRTAKKILKAVRRAR